MRQLTSESEIPDLLKSGEVARLFRVDPRTVTRWANTGRIRYFRTMGGHRRFYRADIERQLNNSDSRNDDGLSGTPSERSEHTKAMRTAGSPEGNRTETEALARFAAEFLYRASWSKATPEGMEKAYLDTIPVEFGKEDLHIRMQELGQRVYSTLHEDFRNWARRTLF